MRCHPRGILRWCHYRQVSTRSRDVRSALRRACAMIASLALHRATHACTSSGFNRVVRLPENLVTLSVLRCERTGFLSECVSVFVWNPWDVVRQRMQLAGSTARSFTDTAQDILRESGPRGFMVGSGAYLALWGCFSPLMFLIYEEGIDRAYRDRPNPEQPAVPSLGVSILFGGIAGSLASIVTSPLDVVKTRIQCQTPTSITQYENVFDGLREIYRNEGFPALFRGLGARAGTMGISCGIMLGSYGFLRARLVPDPNAPAVAPTEGFIPQIGSLWTERVPSSGLSTHMEPMASEFLEGETVTADPLSTEQIGVPPVLNYPATSGKYYRFPSPDPHPAEQRFSDGFIPPLPNPVGLLRDKMMGPPRPD
jgi:hypothetical protein